MSNGWLDTTGTEFGEVDNPDYPGNSKASWDQTQWNRGAWGDDISGWHNQGVALPNAPRGTKVEVRNPTTGETTVAEVKDRGPGESTGAGIDLLPGTGSAIGLPTNYKGPLQYKILGGGVMDEHDAPDKTQVGELPEHLDLEGWDQPHNIPGPAPQETVEAPPVAKRSLIQEFHDKNPNITTSDQGILAEMRQAWAPTMPEADFKAAATTPGGRDIIKEWQERTKTPLEQIRDKHPEWSNYSDDKLTETLYTEWTKNKQLDASKMSLTQFRDRMNPPHDFVNQYARLVDQVKAEIPKQTQAYGAWAVSGTEQHALDAAEPTIRGILAKAYSPDTDLDQLFKKYQGMNPEERKKEFAQAWSTLKQGGSDSARLFDQLNTTFETIDKQAQIQESVNWMKKALVTLDAPGPNQLPANQEQWVKTIAGLPVQAVAALVPGFREMGLFGNLYAHNKASIEQNNPGMNNAEVAKRAENATWWQFPGNELLQLSFLRGGPAITGTIANRLKGIGIQLGTEAIAGAGIGGANQVITNIAAGRDPMQGVGESAGTMAALGLVGRGVGLTVEGLTRAQTQVPEIRRATGISADIVGATPEEANKIVKGDPTAEVNVKAKRNSIDLILSAAQRREERRILASGGERTIEMENERIARGEPIHEPELKITEEPIEGGPEAILSPEQQRAEERRIMGGRLTESEAKDTRTQREKEQDILTGRQPKTRGYQPAPDVTPGQRTRTPADEAFKKAQTARNNGDLDTAQKHVDQGTALLNGKEKKQHQEDVADSVKGLTKNNVRAKLKNVERYMGLNKAPGKRGEAGGMANPFGGTRRPKFTNEQIHAKREEMGLPDTPGGFRAAKRGLEKGEQPAGGIEGRLVKAFKAVSARTGNPNIYIADLVKESGLPLDQVKAWISKEGVEKGRFDLNEGDIGAARSSGRQDVADAAVDMFGRKRVYVDLSRLTEGGEEAEMFSGGNPLPFIRQATKDLGSSEAVKKVVDPVARTFAPEHRGQAAEETAAIVKPITARVKNGIQQGIKIIARAHDMASFLRDAYRSDRRDAWWGNFSDEQIAAWQSMRERGQSTGNEIVDKMFDFTRDVYDWLEELGRENGIDFGHFSDYFHHAFKNTEGEVQQAFKDWEPKFGKQAFQKTRHYPTLADALEAGLKPKSYSPERNLMAYAAAMTTAIRQVQTLKEMSEFNLALPVDDVKAQKLTKQPGWTLYTAPDKQSYYVRNDAAGLLANAFDLHSIYDTIAGPFVAFSRAMKAVTGLKLSWSVFHPLHIATNMWGDVLSTSMQRGLQGTGTAKDFYDALYSTLTVGTGSMVSAYRKYAWLVDALQTGKGLENLSDHQMRDYNDVLDMALNPYMGDDRRAALADMLFRGWNGARKARDWAEAGYKFLTAEPWNEFMFGKVIPCVKIASALARRDALLAKHGESYRSPENMAWKLDLSKINNEVEARFGEMSYDNLFWNRMAKQVGTAVPLSLGWNLGFWKMYGGGVVDLMDNAAHIDQIAKYVATGGKEGRPFNLSNRLLYMVNYTLGTMAVNGVMTYLMTGTMPQGMDFFFPRIGKKANGDDERVRTPYWTGEWASMYEHFKEHRDQNLPAPTAAAYAAADYFGNKANPGLASIWHLMNNKSFMGRDISDMRDPWQKQLTDQVSFVLKDMLLPISMQDLGITGQGIKATDPKGLPLETKQVIMSFLGFTGAPTYTTRTPLQNKIITMFHQQMNMHMGKRESDIFDAKTRYQYAIQSGDQAMQREELANLHQLQAGPRVIEDARKNAKVPPAHRAYRGLTWENQSYLLKHMNPSEYHEYWPLSHPEAKMNYVKTQ